MLLRIQIVHYHFLLLKLSGFNQQIGVIKVTGVYSAVQNPLFRKTLLSKPL